MRITISLDRKDKIPRIRTKWYSSSGDDVRMTNFGITLYEEWIRTLSSVKMKMNGNDLVIEDLGEQR